MLILHFSVFLQSRSLLGPKKEIAFKSNRFVPDLMLSKDGLVEDIPRIMHSSDVLF